MFVITFSTDYKEQEKVLSFEGSLKNGESIQVKTSGSTGTPKTIYHAYNLIMASAKMTNQFFNLNEESKAVLCMSIDTIAGKMMFARAFAGNYSIQINTPSSRPLQKIETNIDFIAMVPVQLAESLKHDLDKLKSIPIILVGGGPISDEIENQLREENMTVYHSFGMTETVSHIAMKRVGLESTPFYEAMPGVTFIEQNDQLILSAPHLGIENLETNDLIELISPTRFKWLGRADWVVNSGGYKIQLEELERIYASQIDVPYFFWKETDEKWGEIVVLCLLNGANADLNLNDLDIPSWKKPKKTYSFSEFIYSESDKILRKRTFDQTSVIIHE